MRGKTRSRQRRSSPSDKTISASRSSSASRSWNATGSEQAEMVLILIHLFRRKDHLTLLVKLDGLSVPGFGGGGVALLDGPLFEPAGTQNVEPAIVV